MNDPKPAIFTTIRARCKTDTPASVVEDLTEEEFTEAKNHSALFNLRVQSALKQRQKEAERMKAASEKWDRFRGFVYNCVQRGGAWCWKIAKDGKPAFGDDYSTKGRVEEAGRTFPDLRFVMQAINEDHDALAIFKAPAVPQNPVPEDVPLPI